MKPTIIIEDDVYKKVMHWVNKSQFEVSGLGMVRVEKDGVLRVVSAILLPQKNGSTHTDIEAEDVNKALYLLRESEGDLRWWWHSHVKMAVFWSGTDHDTIKKIGSGGWFAATVFNQKNEVKSCYYGASGQSTPWGNQPLFLDDLITNVTTLADPRIAEWDAEYDKNVTVKTFQAHDYTSKNYGYYDKESGKWVRPGDPVTEVDIMGESDGDTTTKGGYDPAVSPPLHCPEGMSKGKFKKWNSAHVKYKAKQLQRDFKQTPPVRPPRTPLSILGKQDDGLDAYGFTQEERELFASEGWTINDIDELLDEDITPTDMWRIAKLGVTPSEVHDLIKEHYDAEDIAELLDQSESFGFNMLDQSIKGMERYHE